MELYVYSSDMELQGIVEKIASLIWTRRYWSCGEFNFLFRSPKSIPECL